MVVKLLRLLECNRVIKLKDKEHFHVKNKNKSKKRAFTDR